MTHRRVVCLVVALIVLVGAGDYRLAASTQSVSDRPGARNVQPDVSAQPIIPAGCARGSSAFYSVAGVDVLLTRGVRCVRRLLQVGIRPGHHFVDRMQY